ncbi:Cell division control protein 2-like protein [Morus notabilis]|uniref:cyclin-dependent kinase n=1 Tax=Morus notabilis TaxID=981085 RepID=W9RRA2_9ROSA|nr:cell division control protein 2 homolog [Morus notabilis]EXB93483.1 Cell division control protein 2-like protein [Morus notabilis]
MEKYKRDGVIGKERNSLRQIHKYRRQGSSGGSVVVKRFMLQPKLDALSTRDEEASADPEETGVPIKTLRQISLLKVMQHENIVRLVEMNYEDGDSLVRLVFEYADMDLRNFLEEYAAKASDQKLVKKLLCQLLRGVAHFHSIGAAHGALNPKNVLIDIGNENLKILNIAMDADALYTAPELLLGSTESSPAADMFAVGCIFAEMVNRRPLFQGKAANINNIFNLLGTPTEENWPGKLSEVFPNLEPHGLDLISKLLCLDPSKRIKACAALKHDYFKDLILLR